MMRTLRASGVHIAITKALRIKPAQEFLKPFDHDLFDYQLRCIDYIKSLNSDVNVGTDISRTFTRIKNKCSASKFTPMVIYPKRELGEACRNHVIHETFFDGTVSASTPIERSLLRTNENIITISRPKERL